MKIQNCITARIPFDLRFHVLNKNLLSSAGEKDTCGPSLDVGYFSGFVTEYSDKKHFMKKGFILAYNSSGDTVHPQGEGTAAAAV